MEKIVLTELDLQRAKDYVPVREKEAFVDYCAPRCLVKVTVSLGDGENSAMPNMYMESPFAKSKYLMAALLRLYLGKEKELETADGDEWLMTDQQFDLWNGSHVLNQLERFKRKAGPEVLDKVFDLIRDYKDLEQRLNRAVAQTITIQNDPANRFFLKLTMENTAEALEAQKEALAELTKEMEAYQEAKKAQAEGA